MVSQKILKKPVNAEKVVGTKVKTSADVNDISTLSVPFEIELDENGNPVVCEVEHQNILKMGQHRIQCGNDGGVGQNSGMFSHEMLQNKKMGAVRTHPNKK